MDGEVKTSHDFLYILQAALLETPSTTPENEQFLSGFKVKNHKFWKIGTNIRFLLGFHLNAANDSDIWIMGELFDQSSFSEATARYRKIIWVTYREDFRSLSSEKLISSDMGWGCTVRAAQMMLLECLSRNTSYNSWELIWKIQENLENAPFSLHQIIEVSKEYDKEPGVWYSPSGIGHILTVLLEENPVPRVKSLFFNDGGLYEDEVYSKACDIDRETAFGLCKCLFEEYCDLGERCAECGKKTHSYKWQNSLFIQVSVMLGTGCVAKDYLEPVKYLLTSPFSLGIIGGKPRMTLYVIGFNDSGFVVLDPRYIQRSAQSLDEFKSLLKSYQANNIKILSFSDLEGALSFGFLVKNEDEWRALKAFISQDGVKEVIFVSEQETLTAHDAVLDKNHFC